LLVVVAEAVLVAVAEQEVFVAQFREQHLVEELRQNQL
tara:strand:- start:617 stop:730 length:114 start_codon:yes stop_codon:yes gene_type:complete